MHRVSEHTQTRNAGLGESEAAKAAANRAPLPPDYCGSCYGAEPYNGYCCNTCEDVQEQYRKKGWAFVNADSIEQVHDLVYYG
jgi:hypothetical protein